MNSKLIIDCIIEKSLQYLTYENMVKKLFSILDISKKEIRLILDDLILKGELHYDENNRLFVTSQRGYVKCKLIANKKGYAFAEIIDKTEGEEDIFIPKDMVKDALNGDIVLIDVTNSMGKSLEGRVVEILERANEFIVGELELRAGKTYLIPDDEKFPIIRINAADRLGAVVGDKVVAKILFDNSEYLRGIVVECLGKAGTVSAEQMAIIRSFKLRDVFPENVLNEAKNVPDKVREKDKKDRVDLTELNTITIDGEDSRDFDDAISVEKTTSGYKVGVHIADVSHYVPKNSALDSEAHLRGNSVYFPDQVIPMLPERLSNGICSLREGAERLTLSVLIELDKNCKVKKSNIVNSFIVSKHRMTYTNVQKIIEGDKQTIDQYKDIHKDILIYAEINKKLKELRQARGEIRLAIPEPKVFQNADGTIDRIEKEIQDESHELIESLMILANEVVAETFFVKKIPFVYRIHEKPDSAKVTKLVDTLHGLGIHAEIDVENPNVYDYQKLTKALEGDPREDSLMKLVLRSMMKACYSEKCLGHFGIASTFYCHFTSPIRRYPDLMIHRIIKEYLKGKGSKELCLEYNEAVSNASMQSSMTEKRADEVERAVDDYKKALYMKQRLGEKFDATISGVHEFGIFVELDNTIEGLIRFEYLPVDSYDYDEKSQILKGSKHCYKLGDRVEVVCVNVNIKLRQIDFDLAERLNNATIEELINTRNFGKKSIVHSKKEDKKLSKKKFKKSRKLNKSEYKKSKRNKEFYY